MKEKTYPITSEMLQNYEEIEANYFAMALLMPQKMVKKHFKKGLDLESNDLHVLTEFFGVSEQLMILRLYQLGYFKESFIV